MKARARWHRWLAIFLAVLVLCTAMSGCGKTGVLLSRRMLLQSIGIDREGASFLVTVHMARVGEGEEEAVDVVTARGESVKDAMNNVTLQNGHEPLYSHNLLVLFGEKCAQQGLGSVIDFFIRFAGSNGQMELAQAEGEARGLLTLKQEGKYIPAKDLLDLLESGRTNGKIPKIDLMGFSNMLAGQGSPYLPLFGVANDKPVAKGMACFQKDRLACKLIGDEARGALALMGEVETAAYAVAVPGVGNVTLDTESMESEIEPEITHDGLKFHMTLDCRAAISSLDNAAQEEPGGGAYRAIGERLQQAILEEAKAALQKCVETNADVFSLKRRLLLKDAGYWKAHHRAFEEDLGSASYTVDVKAAVLRVGQERTPTI